MPVFMKIQDKSVNQDQKQVIRYFMSGWGFSHASVTVKLHTKNIPGGKSFLRRNLPTAIGHTFFYVPEHGTISDVKECSMGSLYGYTTR